LNLNSSGPRLDLCLTLWPYHS